MTDRIANLKDFFVTQKAHHNLRQKPLETYILAEEFERENLSDLERSVKRLLYVLENETPVVFETEKIALMRTIPNIPELFTTAETDARREKFKTHERGDVCNINVDYTKLLNCGFAAKKIEINELIAKFQRENNSEKVDYLQKVLSILDATENLTESYRKEALKSGNTVVAKTLESVPKNAPKTFLEALQMFRIIHYVMWCGRNYHNTIGRLDQYMLPYLEKDLKDGRLTKDEAFELLEEFFLSFNRDSDLYFGMQQGDNGQSIVLGGLNEDGSESFNSLSEMCLKASLELKLIDPKINLRVNKNTPVEIYNLGTELTKQGLGFPQYSNDDIVIDGLIKWGYSKKDAYNYVVAACWEFIIPGAGMDIPNIDALSFAEAMQKAVLSNLATCDTYDSLLNHVKQNIIAQSQRLCESTKNVYMHQAPFLSLMMDGCIENAQDISLGCTYNNYGFHGTGLSTAADSLAAIKKYVFDTNKVSKTDLLAALNANFEGYDELFHLLRYDAPKMGNDDDYVDSIATELLDTFADSLDGKNNDRGGIFRCGTGSAMFYIWHSKALSATADGRKCGEGFSANYSPSLFAKCNGPVSMVKSFAKPHLSRVINGGPLTIELHDSLFRSDESTHKAALLVKSFIDLGGHQLQINAVNRDTMLDAQKHPDAYHNLIVRVWGWSGYFVELDKVYQDHIIQRMELALI